MKTIYYTAASLDGFLADENHSLDWLFQLGDPEGGGDYNDFIKDVGAIAMGSSTYEWLLKNHMFVEGKDPQPWMYAQPTWVFSSRTLRPIEGADIRFVRGDVRPVHRDMVAAADGKNLWIAGGGDLAGQFYDAGLLDELAITIASVTLGSGMPLLPRRVNPPLKLLSVAQWGAGFASLRYEVKRAVPKADA